MAPLNDVVLVWLVLPKARPSTAGLVKAISPLLGGSLGEAKKVAGDVLGELKARGLIEADTRLTLTQTGRARALAVLGIPELPKRVKADWKWAKKILVLRALGLGVTPTTLQKAGGAAWLAKSVVIARYRLSVNEDAKAEQVFAALAWKAIGLSENGSFSLTELFGPALLRNAPPTVGAAERPPEPAPERAVSHDGLPDFAARVRGAARTATTGQWHGNKVFISHVWNELRRQDNARSMSFSDFQKRLIDANRAGLVELSRADLVQAMPAEDVSASETPYLNATFHFVRLDDR